MSDGTFTNEDLIKALDSYSMNQSAVQRTVVDAVERSYRGKVVISDPISPAVKCLEMASTLASMHIRKSEVLSRRQYKSIANSYEDLYHHMSDVDYPGRFATPAVGKFTFLFGLEDVLIRAVPTGLNNIRKIVIPRHTAIQVGGHVFTMQYPIEIRVMPHGGIHVVYDGDKPSPLSALESNQVDWQVGTHVADRVEYLSFTVPMQQMELTSYKAPTHRSTLFNKTYNFENEFYHVRVHYKNNSGQWVEMLTTHSGQIFDEFKPTALLKVLNKSVQVIIPQVYFTTNQVSSDVRIDVYTTKGAIELPLLNYQINEFKLKWVDYDSVRDSIYSNPLTNIASLAVYSDQLLIGGHGEMSFEQLRERVIYGTLGNTDTAITATQLEHQLEDLKYDLYKAIDNTTKRKFVAVRTIPKPADSELSSGMGTMVGRLHSTILDLIDHPDVYNNGESITLPPTLLYEEINGVINVMPKSSVEHLLQLDPKSLISQTSDRHFLYSPFHYVLDTSDHSFVTRRYYMNPRVNNKYYVDDNGTVGAFMHISEIEVHHEEGQFIIMVATSSSDAFKDLPDGDIHIQLKVSPVGEIRSAYLNGVLVDKDPATKERIYEFVVDTDYMIDSSNQIRLNSFAIHDATTIPVMLPLRADYDILVAIKDHRLPGQRYTEIDGQLGKHILPTDVIGIFQSRYSISLGDPLDRLWDRARSTLTDHHYVRYPDDVYLTYSHNVYERDARGPIVVTGPDGKPTLKLLHAKGDFILDSNGEKQLEHHKGSVMRGPDGLPIVVNKREINREVDLILFDGLYYFTTSESDLEYKNYVPNLIVEWINNDLLRIQPRLLDESRLQFRPRTTLGDIRVIIGEGREVSYRAEQRITVELYVTEVTARDSSLKTVMSRTVVDTLARLLDKPVVTLEEQMKTIKAALGDDIIGLRITNHGTLGTQPVITLVDNNSRMTVGKKLVVNADGTIGVDDTIAVVYNTHVPA